MSVLCIVVSNKWPCALLSEQPLKHDILKGFRLPRLRPVFFLSIGMSLKKRMNILLVPFLKQNENVCKECPSLAFCGLPLPHIEGKIHCCLYADYFLSWPYLSHFVVVAFVTIFTFWRKSCAKEKKREEKRATPRCTRRPQRSAGVDYIVEHYHGCKNAHSEKRRFRKNPFCITFAATTQNVIYVRGVYLLRQGERFDLTTVWCGAARH